MVGKGGGVEEAAKGGEGRGEEGAITVALFQS
jgi:hypothetical protein